jgi:hypothetical protein
MVNAVCYYSLMKPPNDLQPAASRGFYFCMVQQQRTASRYVASQQDCSRVVSRCARIHKKHIKYDICRLSGSFILRENLCILLLI